MFFPADDGDNYNLWRIKAYLQLVDLFFIKANISSICSKYVFRTILAWLVKFFLDWFIDLKSMAVNCQML